MIKFFLQNPAIGSPLIVLFLAGLWTAYDRYSRNHSRPMTTPNGAAYVPTSEERGASSVGKEE